MELYSGHTFNSKELTRVEPKVKTAIQSAISMVWNKHVGEPISFNVVYASRITDPKTGQPINWSSEYDPDSDSFKFALDTIPERLRIGLELPETSFNIAANVQS